MDKNKINEMKEKVQLIYNATRKAVGFNADQHDEIKNIAISLVKDIDDMNAKFEEYVSEQVKDLKETSELIKEDIESAEQ